MLTDPSAGVFVGRLSAHSQPKMIPRQLLAAAIGFDEPRLDSCAANVRLVSAASTHMYI